MIKCFFSRSVAFYAQMARTLHSFFQENTYIYIYVTFATCTFILIKYHLQVKQNTTNQYDFISKNWRHILTQFSLTRTLFVSIINTQDRSQYPRPLCICRGCPRSSQIPGPLHPVKNLSISTTSTARCQHVFKNTGPDDGGTIFLKAILIQYFNGFQVTR